jgi:ATP-binding cassette, subfamily G (WHITE), member 2, PDR
MVRVTPLTYFVSSMAATSIGDITITCSSTEFLSFNPPVGLNCGAYLSEYIAYAGGTLLNPDAVAGCQFCPVTNSQNILDTLEIYFGNRWKNYGITIVFSIINILASLLFYRAFRVPWKWTGTDGNRKATYKLNE